MDIFKTQTALELREYLLINIFYNIFSNIKVFTLNNNVKVLLKYCKAKSNMLSKSSIKIVMIRFSNKCDEIPDKV